MKVTGASLQSHVDFASQCSLQTSLDQPAQSHPWIWSEIMINVDIFSLILCFSARFVAGKQTQQTVTSWDLQTIVWNWVLIWPTMQNVKLNSLRPWICFSKQQNLQLEIIRLNCIWLAVTQWRVRNCDFPTTGNFTMPNLSAILYNQFQFCTIDTAMLFTVFPYFSG